VLHEAADGGLARIRLPGGLVDGGVLVALAALAESLGGPGGVELTSRGNLQIRGVPPERRAELAAAVADLGLLPSATHERVRNIVASPFAGLTAPGARPGTDPRLAELVDDLDRALCADAALADLSGRFLFGLDDGTGDMAALAPDVLAVAVAGERWWIGPVGVEVGRDGVVDELLAVARAFRLAAARDPASPVWRIRDLPDRGARLAAASRAGRDAVPAPPPGPAEPLIGVWRRPDERPAAAVGVPLGRLTLAAARVLAEARRLRITPWRGIVVPLVVDLDSFVARARRAGLVTDPDSLWTRVTACAGRPGCARALADVRADAASAVAAGRLLPAGASSWLATVGAASSRPAGAGSVAGAGRVHWSGCDRRCGHPGGPHTEVVAGPSGYLVREASAEPKEIAGW
jgi:precorrin-3B synthase